MGNGASAVLPPAAPAPSIPRRRAGEERWPAADQRWKKRLSRQLVTIDAAAVTVAIICAYALRFGVDAGPTVRGMSYPWIGMSIGSGWLAMLAAADGYATRYLGVGAEEYRRITVATFRLWGATAIGCYVLRAEVARGFCLVALPLGLVLLLSGRALARLRLVAVRRAGRARHRVVVVGDRRSAAELVSEFRYEPAAGFDVIGVCVPAGGGYPDAKVGAPVLGSLAAVRSVVMDTGADTVVVTSSAAVDLATTKVIAWDLEGTGVDLVVAPGLARIAGPRVSLRPVAGLPLLHVEEPVFAGWRKVAKNLLDRTVAAAALLVLCPALVVLALCIRLDSRGPALFRQIRTGKDGRPFEILKFRTMYTGAEQRRAALEKWNEADGLLFKIRDDPRITRIGGFLRRLSIDELPQLVNVLRGEMSLVGPRPPLPSEVALYRGSVHRRLKVKPGLTGLWQVNGRSELSWGDAVRLDLYYVENWSITLDLMIIVRTVRAVLRGAGAF
jgi:exopolysaccharide biosynthesis polyprenyl glycosylphosphotransferase